MRFYGLGIDPPVIGPIDIIGVKPPALDPGSIPVRGIDAMIPAPPSPPGYIFGLSPDRLVLYGLGAVALIVGLKILSKR